MGVKSKLLIKINIIKEELRLMLAITSLFRPFALGIFITMLICMESIRNEAGCPHLWHCQITSLQKLHRDTSATNAPTEFKSCTGLFVVFTTK